MSEGIDVLKQLEQARQGINHIRKVVSEVDIKVRAKDSLKAFMEYDGRGNWETCPALDKIIDFLEAVERGEKKRGIICIQPRLGKSQLTTKKFPAWAFMRNPDREFVIASYGADLAEDFSRVARDTVDEHGKSMFDVELDRTNVGRWGLKKHIGGISAVGVGGALTGRGAWIAIIDDPIKDAEQAASKSYKDKLYEWYKTVLRTRLTNDGAIILIMTRWAEDDLAGRLLKEMKNGEGETFEVLSFPAYAKQNDILGRGEGEVLAPKRFPKEVLEETRKAIGRKAWASLYDQSPYIEDGELFKRQYFKYPTFDGYRYYLENEIVHKNQLHIYQVIDTAMKTSKKNDHTAIGTIGVTPKKNILILGMRRGKWEVPDQMDILIIEKSKWRPIYQAIEDKQSGTGLLQEMKKRGFPFKVLKAKGNKAMRAETIAVYYENGCVYHCASIEDLEGFEEELLKFDPDIDNSEDDRVDVVSYAGILVQSGGVGLNTKKPKGW